MCLEVSVSEPTPDVYRAIAYVMKEIGRAGIAKDGRNQQQGYSFRGIDSMFNALNPILADAALCIVPRMASRTQEERQTAKGGVLFYVTVEGQFDFISAKDGSMHTAVIYGEAMDSADKATNKAMSAAYKYACMQTFCIPTEGMEDADATTHAPVPKQPAYVPPPPPSRPTPKPPAERFAQRAEAIATNAVPPAPAGITPANTAPAPAPWNTRPVMQAAFEDVRATVGDQHYFYILQVHNVSTDLHGTASKLKEAYSVLKLRATEIATGEVEGAAV